MAITTVTTSRTYLSTTSVPASKTIKGSPFTMAIRAYCVTSGSSVLDTGGDVGTYIAIVGSTLVGSAFANWASIGNSSSVGSVYCDMSHASTTEEIFVEYGATSNNTWVHWAATYDGTAAPSGFKIYKNGALVTPGSSGGTITTADAWDRILVGGQDGDVQDAWVFNRVLTAAEIALLYGSRFPRVDRTSLVGHWPCINGSNAVDWSGNGRNLTATGSVVDATRQAPVPWGGRGPTIIIPASAAQAITVAGTTNTTGAAAMGEVFAITASGLTQTTGGGSLGESIALTSAGLTNAAGTAAETLSVALAAAGLTNVSGSAVEGFSAAIAAAGLTNTTGAAADGVSYAVTAAGITNTTGAASEGQSVALAAAGLTQTTGAAAMSSTGGTSITAAGTTNVTGAAAMGESVAEIGAGTTQTTGAAALGMRGAIPSSGATQATGAAQLVLVQPIASAGSTQATGAAQMAVVYSISAAGMTNTAGASSGWTVGFKATGTTQTSGIAVMTSSAAVGGGTPKQPSSRRSMSYSGRRHGRV